MLRKIGMPTLMLMILLTISAVLACSYVTYNISGRLDEDAASSRMSLTISVWTVTDVNDDGIIDIYDLHGLGKAYDSASGAANWNPDCDFNGDGKVDSLDLLHLPRTYGESKS